MQVASLARGILFTRAHSVFACRVRVSISRGEVKSRVVARPEGEMMRPQGEVMRTYPQTWSPMTM
jgi:hypothetical protein